MKRHLTLALVAAALVFGGCAKESDLPKATGKGTIRMLNGIPSSPEVAFLIEERLIGTAAPKSVTQTASYDDLDYTFNFETLLTGDTTRTRVASQPLSVVADVDYTMVLSGAVETPDITIWEAPRREWAGSETVFEARVSHHATTLGQVDVYVQDEATPPMVGSQIATVGIGEIGLPTDLETGEYVVTITPAGDDQTILFVSSPVTIAAQSQFTISIFDGDGNDLAPIAVRLFNTTTGGTGAVVDSRFPPQIRFIHASLNFGDADIYIEDLEENPMATPLVTNHTFMEITEFFDVPGGALPIQYTPPGNTGTTIVDVEETIFLGTRTDFYIFVNLNDVDARIADIADRRSVSTNVQFTIMNTVGGRDSVDVYIIPRDELLDDYAPLIPNFPRGTSPIRLPLTPGEYDIYVTEVNDPTILTGPIQWDSAAGDVVQAILFENVDPTVVDFVWVPQP